MKARILLTSIFAVVLLVSRGETASTGPDIPAMVKFNTMKETMAKLLPEAKKLTKRELTLTKGQSAQLKKYSNWDSDETEFTLYHAKNKENKITRTIVIFPEDTRQGMMVVGVAIANDGKIADALVMQADSKTVDGVLPLLRADYMKTFVGKNKDMELALNDDFSGGVLTSISETYALRIANAVKKSCQLFDLVFKRGKHSAK